MDLFLFTEQHAVLIDAFSGQSSDHMARPNLNPYIEGQKYPLVMVTQPVGRHQTVGHQSVSVGYAADSAFGGNTEWPNHYLAWSILNLIFCCLCFGVVAVVKSSDCRSARRVGDYDRALTKSREARKWNTAATVCGLIIVAANIIRLVIVNPLDVEFI